MRDRQPQNEGRLYFLAFISLLLTAVILPAGFMMVSLIAAVVAVIATLLLVGRETLRRRSTGRHDPGSLVGRR